MSLLDVDTEFSRIADAARAETSAPLELIVGFDGSKSSFHALRIARQLMDHHAAHVHVVYVAHLPASAALSAPALVEIRQGFDVIAEELTEAATSILGAPGPRWTLQRRDGANVHELLAAAEELDRPHGRAVIVIVVGTSDHLYHRVAGSVPRQLAHEHKYALTVAPTDPVDRQQTPPIRYTADWR
jgi:nucleotide-binding universal stress UspA family protein